MSNKVTIDPAKVLQRLFADPVGALYAQIAMRDVALEEAHARIAELKKQDEPAAAKTDGEAPAT